MPPLSVSKMMMWIHLYHNNFFAWDLYIDHMVFVHVNYQAEKQNCSAFGNYFTGVGPPFSGVDMEQVGRQLKEAQALHTEILRKSRDHETLNSKGQELISTSDRDGDAVQAVLDGVNNRWTDLNDGMLID